ncbi:MAG: hypothetical protein J6Z43_06035 [Clostridiales bacterium]|nr:hypothetical protein [Clostridiales bacterium]
MKSSNSVRSPKLAASGFQSTKTADLSLGDTLRKAKRDLFFTRCIYAILIVLLVTALVAMYLLGYADLAMDWFYSLM